MINQIGGSSWCSGNCLPIVSGRVILENHLSALCLLISPGPVPEITTYFLGRGPRRWPVTLDPGHMECGYGQPIGFLRSDPSLIATTFPSSGNIFSFPSVNTGFRYLLRKLVV